MTTDNPLLPCPFCGSPALLELDQDHHGGWFNLGCSRHFGNTDKDCPAGRAWYTCGLEEKDEAIRKWNTRAAVPNAMPHDLADETFTTRFVKERYEDIGRTLQGASYTDDDVYMKLPGSTTQPGVMSWKNAYFGMKVENQNKASRVHVLEQRTKELEAALRTSRQAWVDMGMPNSSGVMEKIDKALRGDDEVTG